MRLNSCGLGQGGGRERQCTSTPRSRRSIFTTMTWERARGRRWQRHCASTPRSRRSTLVDNLGEGGGRALTEGLHVNITLTSLNLGGNGLGEAEGRRWQRHCDSTPRSRRSTLAINNLRRGRGRALAEALRLNITLTSHNLGENDLGEGEGRALAEALRLNTTLASLDLGLNGLGEGEGRALAETLRLNTTLTSLDLSDNGIGQEVRSVLRQPGATGEAQRKKLSMADEQLHKHTHTHTRARRVDW
jgi:hypothetical protein